MLRRDARDARLRPGRAWRIIEAVGRSNTPRTWPSSPSFPTGYLGMVRRRQRRQAVRRPHAPGGRRAARTIDRFDGRDYLEHIAEHVEPWSYLKFPYLSQAGLAGAAAYRVGPAGAG